MFCSVYVQSALNGGLFAARLLTAGYNVLVHCTHGWDRTTVVCSLVQILTDPTCRTIVGLILIIEKDWLAFGHKFSDRTGSHAITTSITTPSILNENECQERAPVFLMLLDCLHVLIKKYPKSFEYSSDFLEFLADHVYSQLSGTFLFNNNAQRNDSDSLTCSLWDIVFNELGIDDVSKDLDCSMGRDAYRSTELGVTPRANQGESPVINLRSECTCGLMCRSSAPRAPMSNRGLRNSHGWCNSQYDPSPHVHYRILSLLPIINDICYMTPDTSFCLNDSVSAHEVALWSYYYKN